MANDRVPNVPSKESQRPSTSTVDREVKPFPVKAFPFPPGKAGEPVTGSDRKPVVPGPDKK